MKEQITPSDLQMTMTAKGISKKAQERILRRLQVTGCLISMVADVLDSFMTDEVNMFEILDIRYDHKQKQHKGMMMEGYRKFKYNMKEFTKPFFGNESLQVSIEDNAQGIYDLVKAVADHTKDASELNTIVNSVKRRKCNHHIFEEE